MENRKQGIGNGEWGVKMNKWKGEWEMGKMKWET